MVERVSGVDTDDTTQLTTPPIVNAKKQTQYSSMNIFVLVPQEKINLRQKFAQEILNKHGAPLLSVSLYSCAFQIAMFQIAL